MRHRLLRTFLILEYLLAVQVLFTLWSQVGGQYHLDLMFWPWKLVLPLVAAGLIVAITASAAQGGPSLPRRAKIGLVLLIATFALGGLVTFYYHQNEPTDDEEDVPQEQPALYQTRQEFCPRTIA